jgi:hemoglobin
MPRTIKIFPSVLLMLAASLVAFTQNVPEHSLYQRLGGYDAIASITDVFLGRMRADPRFNRFAGGRSADSRKRARQLTVDLLCQLSGGPCSYIGRPLKAAHSGLGVTVADWGAFLDHVAAALDQQKIPAAEKQEFLALFSSMKVEIVEAGGD